MMIRKYDLLVTILICNCHYLPSLCKTKVKRKQNMDTLITWKWRKNNELEKVGMKNRPCYHFDNKIKIEDFDFDNVLSDEKSSEKNLIYGISYKTLIGAHLCVLWSIK